MWRVINETAANSFFLDKEGNIGLTIPGNWSFEIRRISCFMCEIRQISCVKSGGFHLKSARFHLKSARFHEIRMKSTGFHLKSVRNPPDFMNVSFCVMIKYGSFFRKTKTWTEAVDFSFLFNISRNLVQLTGK